MRISFDLDGTLAFPVDSGRCDPRLPLLERPASALGLRTGAHALLQALIEHGHDVRIYTESLRGKRELIEWLTRCGITPGGVVNGQIHEARWIEEGSQQPKPRKFPPWFGIELHVDNDPAIEAEGRSLGYRVVLVGEDDLNWHAIVLENLGTTDSL